MKTLSGIVVSNKMTKTVVVEVTRFRVHPLYKKAMKRTSRIKAHTDTLIELGTAVKLVAIRPVSTGKHYKVAQVLTVNNKG